MDAKRWTVVGATGSILAAICCFTPVLVIALAAVGVGAAVAWLDVILLPVLAGFMVMTGYGLWRMHRERSN